MSAAHEYMLKTLLKTFGVNPDDLRPENILPMLLRSMNISSDEAREAFGKVQQFIVDYERNQAHQELRMMAIINHLGIVDPVIMINVQLEELSADGDQL